jgi:hypothetical protein
MTHQRTTGSEVNSAVIPAAAAAARGETTPPGTDATATGAPTISARAAALRLHSVTRRSQRHAAIRSGCEQEWLPITWPRAARSRTCARVTNPGRPR